jgi:hypothetical protein
MRRAKLLRTRAQKWPKAKAMRAHKFAGVHQARARHLAANPEPLVEPALPENKQQNALQQDNNTSSLAQNALGQEDHVIFLEALQPTNIRVVECDDPNLRHVPSLAQAGDLSVHVQVQLLDDIVHSLEIQTHAIIEVFGASWSESHPKGKMFCHG